MTMENGPDMPVIEKRGGYTPSYSGPRPTVAPPKPKDAAQASPNKIPLDVQILIEQSRAICSLVDGLTKMEKL